MTTSKKKTGRSKTKSKRTVTPKVSETAINQDIIEIPNVELVAQPIIKPVTDMLKTSKTERLIMFLTSENGATLEELAEATGWLPNSVRGALSAYAKKHPEYLLISEKVQGIRTYRLSKVFNN